MRRWKLCLLATLIGGVGCSCHRGSFVTSFSRSLELKTTVNGVTSRWSLACDDFAKGPLVAERVARIQRASEIRPPLWHNYDPKAHAYVLLKTSTPYCAVVLTDGKVSRVLPLKAHYVPENNIFDLVVKEKISSEGISWSRDGVGGEEINALLSEMVVKWALLFAAESRLKATPFHLEATNTNKNFAEDTLLHEGFHVFGQVEKTGKDWPLWPGREKGLSRDEIAIKCYRPNFKVGERFYLEIRDIASAVQLAVEGKTDLARQAAASFLIARDARRAALGGTKRRAESNLVLLCKQAEARMEMWEGAAEWYGHAPTLVAATVVDVKAFRRFWELFESSGFYAFGMMQLYLLWKLFPEEFDSITRSLSQSKDWSNSIESVFRKHFPRETPPTGRDPGPK